MTQLRAVEPVEIWPDPNAGGAAAPAPGRKGPSSIGSRRHAGPICNGGSRHSQSQAAFSLLSAPGLSHREPEARAAAAIQRESLKVQSFSGAAGSPRIRSRSPASPAIGKGGCAVSDGRCAGIRPTPKAFRNHAVAECSDIPNCGGAKAGRAVTPGAGASRHSNGLPVAPSCASQHLSLPLSRPHPAGALPAAGPRTPAIVRAATAEAGRGTIGLAPCRTGFDPPEPRPAPIAPTADPLKAGRQSPRRDARCGTRRQHRQPRRFDNRRQSQPSRHYLPL